jgi:hypothetical protein
MLGVCTAVSLKEPPGAHETNGGEHDGDDPDRDEGALGALRQRAGQVLKPHPVGIIKR